MTALPTSPPSGGLPPLRWTVDAFHRARSLGLFDGRRAILLRGVILEQGPMSPPHAIAVEKSDAALRVAFGSGWRFRVQLPLVLGQDTDPMPDLAVIRGVPGAVVHPTTADLVVEVSDTTLDADVTEKADLYATAGIADYWVLDLDNRRLLVFRDPVPLPQGLGATAYRTHLTFGPADSVSPLAHPAATVRVAELLP